MTSRLILIFGIYYFSVVMCDKKICDFEDSKCLTETAGRLFKEFIAGIPGAQPSDPLHLDSFETNLPSLKYTITDGKLSGMKNCRLRLVKIYAKDLKYDYYVECPHLTLESEYEMKGEVAGQFAEGKGTCKIDFYDILFPFHGDFTSKDGQGGTTHLNMKTHNLKIEISGKVHYDYKNLFNGDKEKSAAFHKLINESPQTMAKTNEPAMNAFMDKYIDNVNAYLKIVPAQVLFSYE